MKDANVAVAAEAADDLINARQAKAQRAIDYEGPAGAQRERAFSRQGSHLGRRDRGLGNGGAVDQLGKAGIKAGIFYELGVAAQNVICRTQAGSGTDHEPILVIDGVGDGQKPFLCGVNCF